MPGIGGAAAAVADIGGDCGASDRHYGGYAQNEGGVPSLRRIGSLRGMEIRAATMASVA